MPLMIHYDATFAGRFGGDAINVQRRVIAHAAGMFVWGSLNQPIVWQAFEGAQIGEGIEANEGWA
jgi:hypothetical protein